jgi:hypothetical protein
MEAVSSSEIPVLTTGTWRHTQEDGIFLENAIKKNVLQEYLTFRRNQLP